jgi:hypothetical protein
MFVLDVLAPACVRSGLLGIQKQTKARAYHCTGVKVTCAQGDSMTTRLKSFPLRVLGLLQLATLLPAT